MKIEGSAVNDNNNDEETQPEARRVIRECEKWPGEDVYTQVINEQQSAKLW